MGPRQGQGRLLQGRRRRRRADVDRLSARTSTPRRNGRCCRSSTAGRTTASRPTSTIRWNLHLFATKGYVVACVNFHGSSGFGQKFTDSITGDMATKPFDRRHEGDRLHGERSRTSTRTASAAAGAQLRRLHDGLAQRPHRPLQGDGLPRRRLQLAQHDGVRLRPRPRAAARRAAVGRPGEDRQADRRSASPPTSRRRRWSCTARRTTACR